MFSKASFNKNLPRSFVGTDEERLQTESLPPRNARDALPSRPGGPGAESPSRNVISSASREGPQSNSFKSARKASPASRHSYSSGAGNMPLSVSSMKA